MKITVNTGGLQVNFADMVKDVKLIYTNVGNTPFLVDFVDPAGENKTTVVPPAGRYTISSNDGNPTGGRLTFSTESGQTYMVVSKVQEDSTVDGVDEKGYLTGTASKDEVTAITSKTQNQSATSGNTSFTGNLTVSGTISTGSMSDIVGKVKQNQSAISGIQADVATLALSKLSAGQLWFDRGVLSVGSFANLPVSLPLSLCIEYEVESWAGLGSGIDNGIMFFGTRDAVFDSPAQYLGFYFEYNENKQLYFQCSNNSDTSGYKIFSVVSTNNNAGLPTGRHTLVVCAGEVSSGKPSSFKWYLDGVELSQQVTTQTLVSNNLTATRVLSIGQIDNYSNPPAKGGAKIPIKLSRVRIFNFQMDAEDSPYTVADYVSGKDVPPALYTPSASKKALLALEDYTISRNSTTRLVKDVSGNAYDATVVESGGAGDTAWTGTVKGSRDTAVKAFVDEIKTQINQANG